MGPSPRLPQTWDTGACDGLSPPSLTLGFMASPQDRQAVPACVLAAPLPGRLLSPWPAANWDAVPQPP